MPEPALSESARRIGKEATGGFAERRYSRTSVSDIHAAAGLDARIGRALRARSIHA
jgi:hypothetical protein